MRLIFIFFVLLTGIASASACDIKFKILDNKKELYKPGEEFIAKITVIFTHKNCPEGIGATEFKLDGLTISQATKWSETESGTYERKLKLKVTSNKSGKIKLDAVRKCKKDGGFGSLKLKAQPVK